MTRGLRDHFGLTPREVRAGGFDAAARSGSPAMEAGSGEEAVEQMPRWAKSHGATPPPDETLATGF